MSPNRQNALDRQERLHILSQQGYTARAAATAVGVSYSFATQIARKGGFKFKRPPCVRPPRPPGAIRPTGEAKWYVYLLIDPRSGNPFYVGKGTGNRVSVHEREVRTALRQAASGNYIAKTALKNNARYARIADIWAAGLEVGKDIVALFWDEAAALDFERQMMLAIPNLANDTSKVIRPKLGEPFVYSFTPSQIVGGMMACV